MRCVPSGWRLLIFGLLMLFTGGCYGRAVNISNTWTLPQEGFSVFYRFFRDKISWFEADAVCQFHHANLVTVENGVQFDAARAFLKELDVTEFVWIGLMRPQNTDYFVWTNSKPLDSTSGYWADPFPVMESPLCAVIDPVRDFRWHALRCGGPETAAFLCEMEVPDWATECAIRAMPSLTVQYMSDSGTVELSRDCGEEGTRHMSCRGKEDRDTILNELTCVDEIDTTDNTLKASESDLSEVHQKSMELIKNVPTDNKEDNNIESIINKIDVIDSKANSPNHFDDMMMGDQPHNEMKVSTVAPKPVKKSKKADDKYIKKSFKKKMSKIEKPDKHNEEMMFGDQPYESPFNPFAGEEHLPHSKKSLPQDLKHKTTEPTLQIVSTNEPTTTGTPSETHSTTLRTPITVEDVVTETRLRRETEMSTVEPLESSTTRSFHTTVNVVDSPDQQNKVNGHLPKMTKKSLNTNQQHLKELETATLHGSKDKVEYEGSSDHFIPPMLLVRTKFTSTKSHLDNTVFEDNHTVPDVDTPKSVFLTKDSLNLSPNDDLESEPSGHPLILTTVVDSDKPQTSSQGPQTTYSVDIPTTTIVGIKNENLEATTLATTMNISTTASNMDSLIRSSTFDQPELTKESIETTSNRPSFRQPHAPQKQKPLTISPTSLTTIADIEELTTPLTVNDKIVEIKIDGSPTLPTILLSTIQTTENDHSTISSIVSTLGDETPLEVSTTIDSHNSSAIPSTAQIAIGSTDQIQSETYVSDQDLSSSTTIMASIENSSSAENSNKHSDFTNAENFKPYRPNRRRSLTKPETHTYIKKILG